MRVCFVFMILSCHDSVSSKVLSADSSVFGCVCPGRLSRPDWLLARIRYLRKLGGMDWRWLLLSCLHCVEGDCMVWRRHNANPLSGNL
jgi:hypothetical protein